MSRWQVRFAGAGRLKPWTALPSEGSEETSERELVWLGIMAMLDAYDQKYAMP